MTRPNDGEHVSIISRARVSTRGVTRGWAHVLVPTLDHSRVGSANPRLFIFLKPFGRKHVFLYRDYYISYEFSTLLKYFHFLQVVISLT